MGYGGMQLAGPQVWGPPRDMNAAIAILQEAAAAGVLRIVFQQGELFISPCADVGGQGAIIPEIGVRPVDHYAGRLEGLCVSGFVVGQGTINSVVDAPGVKIGSKLRVDGLRMALVNPYV